MQIGVQYGTGGNRTRKVGGAGRGDRQRCRGGASGADPGGGPWVVTMDTALPLTCRALLSPTRGKSPWTPDLILAIAFGPLPMGANL